MKGIFRTILPIIIVIMTAAPKVRGEEPACDFSKYRPIVLSHPLVDAAVKKVEPKYPAIGTRVRAQGEVKVKIMVDRKGNVVSACAIEGHPLLRAPAIHAAVQWKFKPNFGLTARQKRKYHQSFILFNFRLVSFGLYREIRGGAAAQQSLAADGAIAWFSSSLVPSA